MGNEASVPAPSLDRLAKEDVEDEEFWSTVFRASWKGSPAALRAALAHPSNLARLARGAVHRLSKAAGATSPPQGDKAAQAAAAQVRGEALTAADALTHLLPILFDTEGEHHLASTIFWASAPLEPGGALQHVARTLMDTVLVLLAKPGFGRDALPSGAAGVAGNGVGGKCAVARAALLKLMLVTCSENLYCTPDDYRTKENPWLLHYTSQTADNVAPLLAAMLHTVFAYDPAGSGVPYASSIVTDNQEPLVEATLHALVALLDYTPQGEAGWGGGKAKGVATQQVPDTASMEGGGKSGNAFREALKGLGEGADLAFVFKGMSRLLNNPLQAGASYLPASVKEFGCVQELLILLWKLCDENKDFLGYSQRSCDINELVVPILLGMHDARKDPSKIGLIHISTFILLLLSGERNFCVNLNAAYVARGTRDIPYFKGNNADLLYIVYHRLMMEGSKQLDSLYDCWLTTMSNVSPYIKTFCLLAASRAAGVFELFAKPGRLISTENNMRYLIFVLEIFNNAIQYQYEGNPHLIYQILRRKKAFAELSKLVEDPAAAVAAVPEDAAFKPTVEWLKRWTEQLPLQPCMRLLQHLHPQLEDFCQQGNVNDEGVVVDFLKTTTMVGLLPVPHAILIRKYQQNEYTQLWFTTYVWGVCYLANAHIFEGSKIRLFSISYVDS